MTLIIDQLSKAIGLRYFPVTLNTGISLGLFSGINLTALLIVVLIILLATYGKQFLQHSPVAFGVFVGASFSNLLDRMILGGVRDFIPIPFTGVRNNLADWGIFLGLFYLFWQMRRSKKSANEKLEV